MKADALCILDMLIYTGWHRNSAVWKYFYNNWNIRLTEHLKIYAKYC